MIQDRQRSALPVFAPCEDLIVAVLQDYFAGKFITVSSEFYEGMETPAVVVHQHSNTGDGSTYRSWRFTANTVISIDVLTLGPDADQEAGQLHEAVRLALYESLFDSKVYPGLGHLTKVTHGTRPTRVNDWATSSGAVQYASLPNDAARHEAVYRIRYAPDADQSRVENPFVRQRQAY